MSPELKILIFTAAAMGFAYLAVYPRMPKKTITRMMRIDLGIGAVLLVVVGLVYAGQGIGFSLIFFDVPWWLYTLVIAMLVETPLFIWFTRKHGIDITDIDDRD
ncbi:hypothetical protein KDD17_06015 [Sulfitobacter albidus]|uniref:Uncharacterized protein n=1 Tax=Sulfitobacter albidus TaxID=2829501 RepID=A0A975JFF6_9RHOB|nr:hypothetical protein [Sulfitobacter albidus]QUJ77534.1 hypothetical protein KDD17_06015 [Sulfitobacter albidus]